MEEEVNAPACEQANDLIAFLYGELNNIEAQTFQRHMRGCNSCSGELAAFNGIRRSVVAWRDESLGSIFSPTPPYFAAPYAGASQEKPSALAALREFFNLSPIWMKGAVAFATLLFCIFAGLAVARLRTTPPAPLANNPDRPDSKGYSDQQLNALVEQRVQGELQRIKNSSEQSPTPQVVVNRPSNRIPNRRITTRGNEVATNSPARRPLSKVEREQLAADLRLVSLNNDSDLELLDDRINQ